MALETLKKFNLIGDFCIAHFPNPETDDQHLCLNAIQINHEKNIIQFKIQSGPIKEFGKNGCQVDDMIRASLLIIKGLNEIFPSDYNLSAIQHLYSAISELEQRRLDRVQRGAEGYNKK
jgi:hypothetical protein